MSDQDPIIREPGSADAPGKPFEASPRGLVTSDRGCARMAVAGCGLMGLVVALGVLVVVMYASEIASWGFGKIRAEIERVMPDDMLPSDRERFEVAFDAVLEKVESGDLEARSLPPLQAELDRFARRADTPSRSDVLDLIEALETFAGLRADESPPRSPPAEEPAVNGDPPT